jgi:hypothetical protein
MPKKQEESISSFQRTPNTARLFGHAFGIVSQKGAPHLGPLNKALCTKNMDVRNIAVYVASTVILAAIGFVAVGLAFAALFLEGRSGVLGFLLIVVAFLAPAVGAFYVVREMEVVWWYPAVASTAPGVVWFTQELLEPHTNPGILLVPIFLLLLLTAPTGRVAHAHKRKT